ncbi:hypothetical protein [Fluviispira sanaruensis]|uniref:Uncharacterized protein n=1 Tax=Fluviispira sanaruensis TaxID=2493639 RepID=A0A4P2VKM2_FLUSA|nr:hypothetical protein [Fluviispira sanaruensis]BBH52240.1 hypothetical protein JCM31447_315300 [Fluviispira sanaruensis]
MNTNFNKSFKTQLNLPKAELKTGSILLLMDEPTNTTWKHKLIAIGQSIVPSSLGSASLVHATIWCQNKGNLAEPEIAEASGTGKVRTTNLSSGLYFIYYPRNADWGD